MNDQNPQQTSPTNIPNRNHINQSKAQARLLNVVLIYITSIYYNSMGVFVCRATICHLDGQPSQYGRLGGAKRLCRRSRPLTGMHASPRNTNIPSAEGHYQRQPSGMRLYY